MWGCDGCLGQSAPGSTGTSLTGRQVGVFADLSYDEYSKYRRDLPDRMGVLTDSVRAQEAPFELATTPGPHPHRYTSNRTYHRHRGSVRVPSANSTGKPLATSSRMPPGRTTPAPAERY